MAATAAKLALGTSITLATVPIEEVESIGGPKMKAALVDCTNLGSPSGWAEYIVGVLDGGDIPIGGNFTNATGQAALRTALGAAAQAVAILLPGSQPAAGHFNFNGVVTDFALDFKTKSQITFTATIRVTGPVTFSTS
jgi:hypothetical protein